jgi:hypothetical protein
LGQLKAALQAFGREFESIDIAHWWRVLGPRLVLEFREKIRSGKPFECWATPEAAAWHGPFDAASPHRERR